MFYVLYICVLWFLFNGSGHGVWLSIKWWWWIIDCEWRIALHTSDSSAAGNVTSAWKPLTYSHSPCVIFCTQVALRRTRKVRTWKRTTVFIQVWLIHCTLLSMILMKTLLLLLLLLLLLPLLLLLLLLLHYYFWFLLTGLFFLWYKQENAIQDISMKDSHSYKNFARVIPVLKNTHFCHKWIVHIVQLNQWKWSNSAYPGQIQNRFLSRTDLVEMSTDLENWERLCDQPLSISWLYDAYVAARLVLMLSFLPNSLPQYLAIMR